MDGVNLSSVDAWLIASTVGIAMLLAALLGCTREEPGSHPPAVSLRSERRRFRQLVLPDQAVKLTQKKSASSPLFGSHGRLQRMSRTVEEMSRTVEESIKAWLYHGEQTPWDQLELDKERAAGHRPLLVLVNPRSGGGQGAELLRELQTLLHRVQVVDLRKEDPRPALLWWSQIKGYRVLVCGGDGTVGWVLSCLEELQPEYVPPVAILPVGTGNDLARVLGWGGGFGGGSVVPVLQKVGEAHAALLDRWAVVCRDALPAGRPASLPAMGRERRTVAMCNYFGIGIDAAVALDFHQMRERRPHLFVSRLANKLFYLKSGALSPYRKACHDLARKLTLECDGQAVEVPASVEGVVVLNIGSFGGGCDLWGWAADDDSEEEESGEEGGGGDQLPEPRARLRRSLSQVRPSVQDRRLEVVGVHGSLQLGAAQVGLYSATRLAQASVVRFTTAAPLPVEVDGEPWLFAAGGEVEITWRGQAFMLARRAAGSHAVATDVIEWALEQRVIDGEQRKRLMKEIARRAQSAGRLGSTGDVASYF